MAHHIEASGHCNQVMSRHRAKAKREKTRAVEQVFDRGRAIKARAQRCLYKPGDEFGIIYGECETLTVDTLSGCLAQNAPIDEGSYNTARCS